VAELLRRYNVRPDKSLGQNFLIEENALRRIVSAAEISPQEDVLEIGAGLGSLTRHLCGVARHVVAVELDSRLFPLLEEVLSNHKNLRLVQGDILALDPTVLMADSEAARGYLVVANIPYYMTSALLRHLLEAQQTPRRMVLTVQVEVAERICAKPGAMSLLALSVQVYGKPEVIIRIPAGAFYPTPKVDSAVVRVDISATPVIPSAKIDVFFRLAKAGFSQKRKTLRNALSGGMHWSPVRAAELLNLAGIEPMRRAETLSLEEWETLVGVVNSEINSPPDQ
jgi:16S rRNA (adenine1518-N6/adenine1519-N6)-dimethyltransferase